MTKAFVDTTIITNILLKAGDIKNKSLAALAKYNHTELPVYAIKEFKDGPLSYYAYIHNKLAVHKSFSQALSALQKLSATPQRYRLSTSLEALKTAADSISNLTTGELVKKYGNKAVLDIMLADEYRILISTMIIKAWKKRRSCTTEVVNPLSCYKETAPYFKKGLMTLDDRKCPRDIDCCMNSFMKANIPDIKLLFSAINQIQNQRSEDKRRRKVLKNIIRKPKQNFGEKECRDLGDAVFSLYAPSSSAILTTNKRDHEPLAKSLGKKIDAV